MLSYALFFVVPVMQEALYLIPGQHVALWRLNE